MVLRKGEIVKTVFTICVIIMLCVYIAVEEREIKVTKEEAYRDGFRKALKECGKLPTRPIILDDSTEDIDYKCSHCGKEYIVPKDNKPKYCSECGREIDWEDKACGM
jgi:DNA-directed RNA polymerase subunit RPC12/RpoP